jgi:2-(1,2-epoxy-1,2-dihydrophenyl)acetyl-CoA isomerase
MPYETVLLERRGDVAVLTLNRPEALNALNLVLLRELGQALLEVEHSDACALVLTGAGDTFSAGADLNYVRDTVGEGAAVALTPLVDALHAAISKLRSMSIPVLAAVEGSAVGAAFGLALSADLRAVARGARFVPGHLRIGASPDGGVSWLLTRAVGGARATALLLRNRHVSGEDAARLGFADELTDDGCALERAVELAGEVGRPSPMALRHVRELTAKATINTLDQQLDLERERILQIWEGPDFAEGINAFLEKRRPNFASR